MTSQQERRPDESSGWDSIRKKVLDRDGFACRFCGMSNEEHLEKHDQGLHAHHIVPDNDGGRDHPSNLITVCCTCHRTLESTHGQAVKEVEPDVSEKNIALIRTFLEGIKRECSWLWNDQLTKLKDIPRVENYDLYESDGFSPIESDVLTDREKACYMLGKIQAYSHAGTHIEAALDKVNRGQIRDERIEDYHSAGGYFTNSDDKPDPDFHNPLGF